MSWKPIKKSIAKIEAILQQYRIEGAMTLRRTFYVLVSKGLIKNSRSSYIQLSKLFKKARIEGLLPYGYIIDTTREIKRRATYSDFPEAFDLLCKFFRKDSLQEQEVYLEVWLEKEAIVNLIEPITYPLDIPLVVSKGFTSVTLKKDASDRFNEASKQGKKVIVLFVSDFDAEGEYIPQVLEQDLVYDYGCVADVEIKKVLLNLSDVNEHNLNSNEGYLVSKKNKEKGYVQKFISKYGEVQYELDALHPNVLKLKVMNAIEEYLDVSIAENSDGLSAKEMENWKKENLKGEMSG